MFKDPVAPIILNSNVKIFNQVTQKTLAELYDPDKIPEGLKFVHSQLDFAIEKIYRSKPFESDEERLEYLFKLYEKMIDEEKNNNKK